LIMSKVFTRWQQKRIQEVLKSRRVVIISGARQSGKTTLAQTIAGEEDTFLSLDNEGILATALSDPMGFVRHKKGTLIIDEIQKAPSLLLAIKQVVDADNRAGQFLLTGSADIATLPKITDSLAGRISHIRLRGLTMGEVLERQPTFLDKAFKRDWPLQIKGYDKPTILNLAFAGGYPEALRLSQAERDLWFTDYKKSLLSRDLKDIANIQRHSVMEALLSALSAWSGKLMDVEAICGKLSITRKLLINYVDILVLLCLFEKVPAWILTDYDRVGRKEKIFATDTGLMAHLLDWREADVLYDPDKSGKMIETFAFNQLCAQTDFYRYSLYHYRDRQKREIDFIVKNDVGGLLGIEIKSGSAISRNDAQHLVWFKNNIALDRSFIGIVLYTGDTVLPLGQDMYAVPMAALWS